MHDLRHCELHGEEFRVTALPGGDQCPRCLAESVREPVLPAIGASTQPNSHVNGHGPSDALLDLLIDDL